MKKIVFVNQVTGYLMKDIINVFCRDFNQVGLIAGSVSGSGDPLDGKVKVTRIIKYDKKNLPRRIFSWLWATIQTFILVNTRYRSYHVFFTSNPPPLVFIPFIKRRGYSILVYDIYPDGLIATKFIGKDSVISKIWTRRNFRFYKRAKNIFTLTESMAHTLSKYVAMGKINVISPWSVFKEADSIPSGNNTFRATHNLGNKFIVLYSGNIGLGHNVESLVEVARLLKNEPGIIFVIIGEGWTKKDIEEKIRSHELSNCITLPFQPYNLFRSALHEADLGVVSQISVGANLCAPSKTYNLIGMKIPLLCMAYDKSELADLVEKYEIGKTFSPSEHEAMARYITEMKIDKTMYNKYKERLHICVEDFTFRNAYVYLEEFKF